MGDSGRNRNNKFRDVCQAAGERQKGKGDFHGRRDRATRSRRKRSGKDRADAIVYGDAHRGVVQFAHGGLARRLCHRRFKNRRRAQPCDSHPAGGTRVFCLLCINRKRGAAAFGVCRTANRKAISR